MKTYIVKITTDSGTRTEWVSATDSVDAIKSVYTLIRAKERIGTFSGRVEKIEIGEVS